MVSISNAAMFLRVVLATVTLVGVAGFVVVRDSQSPSVSSPLTICSRSKEGALPDEKSYLAEQDAAMNRMIADMAVDPTGDVDRDFVWMMTPHHQGAIDMARAVLRYGRNEQIRRLAQEIIVTQQQEIVAMRRAIGEALPASGMQVSAPSGDSFWNTSFVPSVQETGVAR